eukprot:scaffold41796_cov51-Attheya_sp.AAC.4
MTHRSCGSRINTCTVLICKYEGVPMVIHTCDSRSELERWGETATCGNEFQTSKRGAVSNFEMAGNCTKYSTLLHQISLASYSHENDELRTYTVSNIEDDI